eukprot:4848931-Pleurochrysis_carterae.AAC.1
MRACTPRQAVFWTEYTGRTRGVLLRHCASGLLATLDGKKKMTTMEKSRHDWGNFKEKQDEST